MMRRIDTNFNRERFYLPTGQSAPLEENNQVRERRNQLQYPNYTKHELLATQPKQLWSWDITKMLEPVKWTYYFLYAILDVYSRYFVGWMIAEREAAHLAQELIAMTCLPQHSTL
jgi:putative transposase